MPKSFARQVVARHQAGESLASLARTTRCSLDHLKIILKQPGIPPSELPLPRSSDFTTQEVQEILFRYRNGESLTQIGRSLQTTYGHVMWTLQRANIPIRPQRDRYFTPEQEQQIAERYLAGESTSMLADEWQVTTKTILRTVRRAGHTPRPGSRSTSRTSAESD